MVYLAPRILSTVLPQEPAAIVQKHIERAGVRFHLGQSVTRFERNVAHLSGGDTLAFDVLVMAVGVRASTQLAQTAGLALERGIVVDEGCRTSEADIFAAGDCTGLPLQVAKAVGEGCIAALSAAQELR